MNVFLRELCNWLDGNRFGKKVLFCRSRVTGQQLLRMAAGAGVPVVNTQAVTVGEYIDQRSSPELIDRGLKRIDRITAAIALREIMEGCGDAFTTLGVVELATAQSVLSLLEELEQCELLPEALEAIGEELLAKVWRDYMDYRRQNGYASRGEILSAAAPEGGVSYAILSNLPLSPMERRFLSTLPGLTVIHMVTPQGAAVPRNALLQTEPSGPEVCTPSQCVECQDVGAEIRWALQTLIEARIPAEDAVIVCPDQAYGLRVAEEARLLGIGLGSAFGVPAPMTKTALLLRSLLDWTRRDYDVEALSQALISAGMAIYDEDRSLLMNGQTLLRLLRNQGVGWGAERWDELSTSDEEHCAVAGEVMAGWVNLFEAGELPVREIAHQLTGLLNRCMPRGVENDFYLNVLDEVSRVYAGHMSARDYLSLVEAVAQGYSVGSEPTEAPGKVYCCAYESAMYVDRRHFILLGMSWDAFDRLGREFPLLHDEEKARLSPALRLVGDGPRERRYAVRELLANRPEAEVTFSRALMDRVGGEERMASSLFDDAVKQLGPARQVTILGRAPLTELDVHLKSGLHRDEEVFMADEGREDLWRRAFEGRIWTATNLEKALICPRSFVLSCQMGVGEERPQALSPYGQVWLNPIARGNLLHDILDKYFRAIAPRAEAVDDQLLRRLTDESVNRYKALIPIPINLTDVGPEVAGILDVAAQEARMHAEDGARETLACEYAFGSNDPVQLTFGPHTIRLVGKIDRVDRVGEACEVIDYKTGRPQRFIGELDHKLQYYLYTLAWEKTHPGQRVSRAAYHLLDGAGGVERVSIEMTEEARDQMYEKVTDLLSLLADPCEALSTGNTPRASGGCPSYCPYQRICSGLTWPESEDMGD